MLPTLPPPADYEITEPEPRAPHGFGFVLLAVLTVGLVAGFAIARMIG